MRVHAAIARSLKDLGVETMFGLVGDANLLIVHSYVNESGGTYVSSTNEAGAVLMAIGHATTSGKVGVATVTHGPGLTNTITALVHGVRSRTPIVLLAADTAVADRDHLQNIAQRELVMPTGAGFEQLRSPSTVGPDLERAFRRALDEQRPIVLNVPTDLKRLDAPEPAVTRPGPRPAVRPDPDQLDAAVGIIATARRPIVLAGRGATSAAAKASLLRLAERIGAPVATTLKAKDLFRGEPFDLGLFGTLSPAGSVDAILASDCVIAFGASLNGWTTASGSYTSARRVVHCDLDPSRIGIATRVDAAVTGDASAVADTIVEWLDAAEVSRSDFRNDVVERRRAQLDLGGEHEVEPESGDLDIYRALRAINSAAPPDRTAVFDAGRFVIPAMKAIDVPGPNAWVTTLDFASIGLGLSTAIGASYGRPSHPVLLVCGDGGFMLGGLSDFNSAVRHGVDLIVAVLNDGSYGAELRHLRADGLDTALSLFDWPDLAPVAEALGGQGFTVREAADLADLPKVIADRTRPLLIDIKLDPLAVPSPDEG